MVNRSICINVLINPAGDQSRGRVKVRLHLNVSGCPHSHLLQLPLNDPGPVAIGGGIGRAGMQNASKSWCPGGKNLRGALKGKIANSDEPLRLKRADDRSQMRIARGEEGELLGGWEFVGCAVTSSVLDESQRAIVDDDM